MRMILSPYCCTVTIFEYSSTDVTLLPSCLPVLSEHVASQSKIMAECRFSKEEEKCVASAILR